MNFQPNLNDERTSKMIPSSREKDFQAKQEGGTNESKFSKASSSSSRQWSAFKNPRIVRVSRSFGGKDRHSKVCTIRGLRDRRIRLSVPTAIQLYDLQDRLGLSQPSKVVDWLLDATKHEIDKLPPLQMPQGNFTQFHEPNALESSLSPFFNPNQAYVKEGGTQSLLSRKELGFNINQSVGDDQMMARSKAWDSIATLRGKSKEVGKDHTIVEKTKWFKTNDQQENQDGIGAYTSQVSAQNFFPIANHSSFPNLLNNPMPYNPYYHLEPSNLSLSQFGGHGFSSQTEDLHSNAHSMSLPLSLSSGPPLFFCPPSATPSLFPPYPPYNISTPMENDLRQMNHFQLLSSNSQPILPNPLMSTIKPSQLNLNPKVLHLHSQNNDESQPNKGSIGS